MRPMKRVVLLKLSKSTNRENQENPKTVAKHIVSALHRSRIKKDRLEED